MTLFAGQPDAIHVGEPPRVAQRSRQCIDAALECLDVTERFKRDGDDRLSRVRRRAIVLVEVDRIRTIRSAVERAGKETENQCQAITLVTADRQQETLICAR